MSLAYDQQMDAEMAAQAERDARDFVVGAVVYRAHDGAIEEGVVTDVDRCVREEDGPSKHGTLPLYTARFEQVGKRPDYVSQTDAWKFYACRQDALVDLQENLEGELSAEALALKGVQDRIARKEAKLAALKAEIAAGPAPVALRL